MAEQLKDVKMLGTCLVRRFPGLYAMHKVVSRASRVGERMPVETGAQPI